MGPRRRAGRRFADKPPLAVQGTVKAVWDSLSMSIEASGRCPLMYTQLINPMTKTEFDPGADRTGNPLMRIVAEGALHRSEVIDRPDRNGRDIGLHGLWISEPWGYDCSALLGWCAAHTDRLELGTHVSSVYARSPAMIAGLAGSLWSLTEGRFRLGLGVSGPARGGGLARRRVRPSDGAHPRHGRGDPPGAVRRAVSHRGEAISVPRAESRWRPLRFAQQSGDAHVPIYLAALGPANQRLTAEIADGWTPTPYSPDHHQAFAGPLLEALDPTAAVCNSPRWHPGRRNRTRGAARARARLVGVVPGVDGRVLCRGGAQNGLRRHGRRHPRPP